MQVWLQGFMHVHSCWLAWLGCCLLASPRARPQAHGRLKPALICFPWACVLKLPPAPRITGTAQACQQCVDALLGRCPRCPTQIPRPFPRFLPLSTRVCRASCSFSLPGQPVADFECASGPGSGSSQQGSVITTGQLLLRISSDALDERTKAAGGPRPGHAVHAAGSRQRTSWISRVEQLPPSANAGKEPLACALCW